MHWNELCRFLPDVVLVRSAPPIGSSRVWLYFQGSAEFRVGNPPRFIYSSSSHRGHSRCFRGIVLESVLLRPCSFGCPGSPGTYPGGTAGSQCVRVSGVTSSCRAVPLKMPRVHTMSAETSRVPAFSAAPGGVRICHFVRLVDGQRLLFITAHLLSICCLCAIHEAPCPRR